MKHSQMGADRDTLLGLVVDEFFDALDRGEKADVEDYARRYPGIADLLRVAIPAVLAAEATALNSQDRLDVGGGSPPKQLGDFRIIRQIGRGGMGIVYEAEQLSMHRRVALKVLPLAGLIDETKIQRFQNEVRAAASLDHPNIVSVYLVGEERGVHYYAMQLIRGRSMSEVITSLRNIQEQGVPLDSSSLIQVANQGQNNGVYALEASIESAKPEMQPVETYKCMETVASADDSTIPHASKRQYFRSVAELGIQIATALQHAHDRGIIHRDVKPANLLLDRSCRLHLADFGLARINADVGLSITGDMMGTLRYMAPEQALAKRTVIDHRADIYSLGVTLYELLVLRPAYVAEDREVLLKQIVFEEPTPLRRLDSAIPVELATIVQKAMSKELAERYETAEEFADDLQSHLDSRPVKAKPPTLLQRVNKWRRRNPILTLATVVTLALSTLVLSTTWDRWNERWAREQLSVLRQFIDGEEYAEALDLAEKLERIIPGDPTLEAMWPEFSIETSVQTDPEGSQVAIRAWDATNTAWRNLGAAPLDHVRIPKGPLHWKINKKDHDPLTVLRPNPHQKYRFRLEKSTRQSSGMVHVAGGQKTPILLIGLTHVEPVSVGDYLIDRHEVTNREFQQFVDAGGYTSQQFWKHFFDAAEEELSWKDAMSKFVDTTNTPGPAGWKTGRYPAGEAEYPVRGVSWFEAAAYAEFAGKRLPSVYHWARAADTWNAYCISPVSNFDRETPSPAGQYQGVGSHGAFDMAGNVKEWCWNADTAGNRYILGGAWSDLAYMSIDPDEKSPWDRTKTNGFRCVKVLADQDTSPLVDQNLKRHRRNVDTVVRISDDVLESYRSQYAYEKQAPLNAEVLWTQERDGYLHDKIVFDAADRKDEHVTVHFYRPSNTQPPYQTVVYFPPAHALHQGPFDERDIHWQISFLVRQGRAVLYPIYRGTFDDNRVKKESRLNTLFNREMISYRNHVIDWSKDLSRSIDYLEQRSDVDPEKLAYYGYSLGGVLWPIFSVMEERLKVAIVSGAGISPGVPRPEADPLNYLPRVTIPTLMLNGRGNTFFPLELAVQPWFELLGTPKADKDLKTFESGQFIPEKDLSRESAAWLDKYLGPVETLP